MQDYKHFKLILILDLCLTAPVASYERVWFFGDDFGQRSFKQHFKGRKSMDYNAYVKANFDFTGFFASFINDNPSLISRMTNLLINAIECKVNGRLLPLPKIVVVVPDNDIICLLSDKDCFSGIAQLLSQIVNHIMTEYERTLAVYKEYLSAKSLHPGYPHILWIQAPQHNNFKDNSLRFKFNKCINELVHHHANTSTLELKKVWDPSDVNLFLAESQRFTNEGYHAYWEAVDWTVRYFDSVILRKTEKQKVHGFRKQHGHTHLAKSQPYHKDHFRWQNPRFNYDVPSNDYKKLPTPPQR